PPRRLPEARRGQAGGTAQVLQHLGSKEEVVFLHRFISTGANGPRNPQPLVPVASSSHPGGGQPRRESRSIPRRARIARRRCLARCSSDPRAVCCTVISSETSS